MLRTAFNDATFGDYTLLELSPDDTHYLPQIAGKDEEGNDRDRVHPFGTQTIEDLLTYRIGGDGYCKSAFAIVRGRDVASVIYGIKGSRKIVEGNELPGKVDTVLRHKSTEPFPDLTASYTFYSISAFKSGAGPRTIQALLASRPEGVAAATLSPMRSIAKNYPQLAQANLSIEERVTLAFLNLLPVKADLTPKDIKEEMDGTQLFHMLRNGAGIAAIHTDANTPDSEDAHKGKGMMINYLYPDTGEERAEYSRLLHAIHAGKSAPEHFISLLKPALAKKVLSYMKGGALKDYYDPSLTGKMEDVLERIPPALCVTQSAPSLTIGT